MSSIYWGGTSPADVATNSACLEVLEHHADTLAIVTAEPFALVTAVRAHCATLSRSEEVMAGSVLSLRPYQLDPSFLWAPPAARNAAVAWAKDTYVAQLASLTEPFAELPDDCAGDILEYLEWLLHREAILHIAEHCSSPEAIEWVKSINTAAVLVCTVSRFWKWYRKMTHDSC